MQVLKPTEAARMLMEASERLAPVNVMTDPAPQQNLSAAYESAKLVWKESDAMIDAPRRRKLRVAALAVKAVYDQVVKNAALYERDNQTLRAAEATFVEVAKKLSSNIEKATPQPQMQHSAIGMRMKSLHELADAKPFIELPARNAAPVVAAIDPEQEREMDIISKLNSLRSKLPKQIKTGQSFLVVRMPLIVTTSKGVNESALGRSGLKWMTLRRGGLSQAGGSKRLSPESGNALLLEDQVVVAMRPDEVDDKRDSKQVFGIKSRTMTHKPKMTLGVASRATKLVSEKLGEHVNGLSHTEHKYFRSPGNQLVFMWLVPAHAISALNGFAIKAVSFPWLSRETHEQTTSRAAALTSELKELEQQQEILSRRGEQLNEETLLRIAEIRKQLGGISAKPASSPEDRAKKLEELRKQLEAELTQRFGPVMDRLVQLKKDLAEDPKDPKLSKEIRINEKIIADAREMIASRLRRQLR